MAGTVGQGREGQGRMGWSRAGQSTALNSLLKGEIVLTLPSIGYAPFTGLPDRKANTKGAGACRGRGPGAQRLMKEWQPQEQEPHGTAVAWPWHGRACRGQLSSSPGTGADVGAAAAPPTGDLPSGV